MQKKTRLVIDCDKNIERRDLNDVVINFNDYFKNHANFYLA